MAALRILVTGATGFVGPFVVGALRARGHEVVTVARSQGDAVVDLSIPGMADAVTEALAPDLVLNLAAMASIAACEASPERARAIHVDVPERFARRFGARLLHVSTDLVFDGRRAPYSEDSPTAPLSIYGATKAEGEERARRHAGRVVRLPLLFGPDARGRGATASLRAAQAARAVSRLYTNEYRAPLHVADATAALVELVLDPGAPGIVHVPGPERCSRWELARRFCAIHGLDESLLVPVECEDAHRPRDVSLAGVFAPRRSLDAMLTEG